MPLGEYDGTICARLCGGGGGGDAGCRYRYCSNVFALF